MKEVPVKAVINKRQVSSRMGAILIDGANHGSTPGPAREPIIPWTAGPAWPVTSNRMGRQPGPVREIIISRASARPG